MTASAEQIPRICRAIGLFLKIGPVRIVFYGFHDQASPCFQIVEKRLETVFTQPELHQIGYPLDVRVAPASPSTCQGAFVAAGSTEPLIRPTATSPSR